MRLIRKWGLPVLALVLIGVFATALFKRDELTRFFAVTTLFDEDKIVANFSSMGSTFNWALVPRGDGPAVKLQQGIQKPIPPDVEDWVVARDVTSLMVVKRGQIMFESYYLGTTRDDRRISWSMAKSFLSALFGIAVSEGKIGSLDDKVTDYVPALKGGAYSDVTIRQCLTMTSGVTFNEDYLDYYSDINRMGRVLALGDTMDAFAASLTARDAEPGERWKYTSIDTHVVAMVLRAATGKSLPDLMSEKLIQPLGVDLTPYYLTDGVGVAFALGGLNMTTRDYARFGQMMLQGGFWDGRQIVPRDWIEVSTRPQAETEPGQNGYGYQWWLPPAAPEGEFFARGIYGQYLYINEDLDAVVVVTAADRLFREEGASGQNIAILRLLANVM